MRIKWVSVVAAIAVALISAASAVTIAGIEYISKRAEVKTQNDTKLADQAHKNADQERLFLETFANQVMKGDLNYRKDFALYVKTVSKDIEMRTRWGEYSVEIDDQIASTEILLNRVEVELTNLLQDSDDPRSQLVTARLQKQYDHLVNLLEGGADIRTRVQPTAPPRTTITPEFMKDFMDFFKDLNIKHFAGPEFLILGASNAVTGLNSPAPKELWPNIAKIARVIDEFRERHGADVRITSAYRSKEYNASLNSSPRSLHIEGAAVDFTASIGRPSDWAKLLREMRREGFFQGGIGTYNSYVHVDVSGINRDWGN